MGTNSAKAQGQIDKAIAAANARRLAKQKAIAEGKTEDSTAAVARQAKPTEKKVVLSKEDREAKRLADKAVRDAAREVKKAQKAAEKAAKSVDKLPAHMGKVEKAGAALPQMDDSTLAAYDLVRGGDLTEGQLAILVAHLGHYNRVRATVRSADCKLVEGQTVEIIASDRDPRLIGKRGTISQVRKIRVLVTVPGMRKEAYLFAADVAPYTATEEAPAVAPGNILDEVPGEAPLTVEPEAPAADFFAPEAEESTGTDAE